MGGKTFLLTLDLKTQGKVVGSSTRKDGGLDYSKGLVCHSFTYEVISQIDSGSGQPVGRRQHKPITIQIEVDSAIPKLKHAMLTNEVVKTAILSFDKISSDGKPCQVQTIKLTNCIVAGGWGPAGGVMNHEGTRGGKRLERVTLTYEDITVNQLRDGIIPYSLIG